MKKANGWAAAALALVMTASPAFSANDPAAPQRAGQAAAALEAKLVDPDKHAQQAAARVEVKVSGIDLIDPAKAQEARKQGQGHLHYRVDDGPWIATTTTLLSFHELKPGEHVITVRLAENDHSPMGQEKKLNLSVPDSAKQG